MGIKTAAESIDVYVGWRLRTLRQARRMSLEKAAELLGVSQQQFSRYELGRNRLGAVQVYQLSRNLNVPVGWFFRGLDGTDACPPPDPESNQNEADKPLSTREEALLRAWRALDSELQRDTTLALLEAFAPN